MTREQAVEKILGGEELPSYHVLVEINKRLESEGISIETRRLELLKHDGVDFGDAVRKTTQNKR